MKKLLTLLAAFSLLTIQMPVIANDDTPEVCVLEYNEDGTVKNAEEYQKCIDEHYGIEPLDGKFDDPRKE